MKPVQLFCWHFMAYPYLAKDFDEKESSGWVTVPNRLWDNTKARGLYQEYIDQLVYADELGFDGMVLNEHHQNIYGLMPSPNMIAAALTQNTSRGKIIILGNLLPLHLNPMRVAEEYAMLDQMSNGRLDRRLRAGRRSGDFQLRRAIGEHPGKILGSRRSDRALVDRRRAVRARRPLFSAALCESLAQAAAKTISAGVDPRLAQPFDHDRSGQARLLLFSLFAQPRRRDPSRATGICRGVGKARRQVSSVSLRHFDVDLRRRDRSAGARGMRRRRLVFFEKLSQGPPAPRRPSTHLWPRRAVYPGRRVARIS